MARIGLGIVCAPTNISDIVATRQTGKRVQLTAARSCSGRVTGASQRRKNKDADGTFGDDNQHYRQEPMDSTYKRIITAISKQPLISQSAIRLVSVIQDEDHSSTDLMRIINQDPTMTAEILKTVNSSAYGLKKRIESISHALILIGERILFRLALHACTGPLYSRPLPFYEKQKGAIWIHSLKTGIASARLAASCKVTVDKDVAYTAGILADIGKTVTGQFLMEHKMEIVDLMAQTSDNENFISIERKVLGVDHCQVGAELAKHWKLPEVLCQCIGHHHYPEQIDDDDTSRAIAYVVHVGDVVAMIGSGGGVDTCLSYPIGCGYEDYLSVGPGEMAKIAIEVNREVAKYTESMQTA